uniref:Uncharacterized protein n=1 Tax=Panagrolaimus sp. ES5 TaxID=591445 RepID=A0AC34FHP9_9BILA
MRILPLGCWLFWVPKLTPTHAVFRRIEWLVFQSPILRIFMEILNIIVYMEIGHRTNIFFSITSVLGIISLFIASWGSYMIIPLGSSLLKNYRLSFMFHLVDTAQLIYSVQKFIFDFLVGVDIIQSDEFLPAQSKALYWMCFLLTLEMFVVSIIATFAFRPSQTEFFDKFNRLTHNRLQGSTEFPSRNVSSENFENLHHIQSITDSNKSVKDFEITNIVTSGEKSNYDTCIGNGNESGLGSVSSASMESGNLNFPMDVERLDSTSCFENEVNENDLTEINLNSSRSEKSNLHDNKNIHKF